MKKQIFFVFVLLGFLILPFVSISSYGWGFKRNTDHLPPDIGKYADEISGTNSFYVGSTSEKVVYLTFDAGYDNGNMEKILQTLKEKDVSSTFFVTGDFLVRQSELTKKIVENGHIVGNHSWSHKNITNLSREELTQELKKVEQKYNELTNQEMIKFFRPPAGDFDKQSLNIVKELGYTTFFWSIAFKDWLNEEKGREYSYNSVVDNLHNGAIILLHTVSKDNLAALPDIIDGIREQGYVIKNLDYLQPSS